MNSGNKKKVGIITFHFVNNFGGALQAYALSSYIRNNFDADTYIIDYRTWFIRLTDFIRMFPVTTNISELGSGLKCLSKRVKRLNKFRSFMNENCQLSRTFYTSNSISEKKLQYDKYICGSDQIWNPILTAGICKAYFLDFVKNSEDKIAYAPSFGTSRIPEVFLRRMGPMIDKIGYLSVREKEGKKLIRHLSGRESERLIDPVFLPEKKCWDEVAKKVDVPEKYILLYIMQNDSSIYEYLHEMKAEKGLPVVEISRYGYKDKSVDHVLIDIGPAEFVYLFQHAEVVCTNSYHGLVYSLIFNKDLLLVPSKKFKGRMGNLLELLNIHPDEALTSEKIYDLNYNYEEVQNIISEKRNQAFSFLNKGINSK